MLNVEASGSGPPLVVVHGFTQTARSWGEVGRRLAQRHRVLAVDAPGHGRSAAVAVGLWEGADELIRAGGTADYLGYSMGGRLCLHAALAAPDRVLRLVLVGATAGIADPAERAARAAADDRLAASLVTGGDAGLPAFLEQWLAGPLFATLAPGAAALETRRANTAAGLATSLTLMGSGAQEPLDGRLGELTMPVLCVVGEHDAKFRAEAERLAAGIGDGATVVVIPCAGHACHLERPGPFVDAVEAWFTATAPAPG